MYLTGILNSIHVLKTVNKCLKYRILFVSNGVFVMLSFFHIHATMLRVMAIPSVDLHVNETCRELLHML